MKNTMKIGFASAWLVALVACGQAVPQEQPVRIELASGRPLDTTLANRPLRLDTLVGRLVFQPGELAKIEFKADGLGEATTIYGDRWNLNATSAVLMDMVAHAGLYEYWDQVQSATFLAPSSAVQQGETFWTATLADGSEILMRPRGEALSLIVSEDRLDIPWPILRSVKIAADPTRILAEIDPGKFGFDGFLRSKAFPAEDLGGRRFTLKWEEIKKISRKDASLAASSHWRLSHALACRGFDGAEGNVVAPISVLRVNGRGGEWILPSTRISKAWLNPDGSHSVQTTAGEWLTGKIRPAILPLAKCAETPPLRLADFESLEWDNPPADIPEEYAVWRLKSGDLMVGKWLNPPEEPAAPQRVKSQAAAQRAPLPAQIDGRWPVSRFEVEYWASGTRMNLSASDVEAVGRGPVAQMPPALVPNGPSAVRSDEVLLSGGAFQMGRSAGEGAADELPPVELFVEAFWLANTPVTVTQFAEFVAATKHITESERTPGAATWRTPGFAQRPEAPVVCVSWRDAVLYCNWRSAKAGLKPCYDLGRPEEPVAFLPDLNGYRLPLEAEWEYAARSGGQDSVYPWGDESDEEKAVARANFRASGEPSDPWPWTNPVKAFPPVAGGFYDLAGNVWEWCQDVYRSDAYAAALRGESLAGNLNAPPGLEVRRAMRGGSYHNGLEFLRCAARGHGLERMSAPRVGFRVARNAEPLNP